MSNLVRAFVKFLKRIVLSLETKVESYKFDLNQSFKTRDGEVKIIDRKKNIRGTKMYGILFPDGKKTYWSEKTLSTFVDRAWSKYN